MNEPQRPHNPYSAPTTVSHEPLPIQEGLASRGTRLGAAILDNIFIMIPLIALIFILDLFPFANGEVRELNLVQNLMIFVVSIGTMLVLNGYFLHTRGQSLGKMILSIRIVRVDNKPANGLDTIVKRLFPIWIVAQIPGIGGLLTLIDACFIFRADRRCIHDLIAGTKVVVVPKGKS